MFIEKYMKILSYMERHYGRLKGVLFADLSHLKIYYILFDDVFYRVQEFILISVLCLFYKLQTLSIPGMSKHIQGHKKITTYVL